jgi:hypothetical protein
MDKVEPFHEVRAKAFRILDGPHIDFVADHITTDVKFDETAYQWKHIDALASQFKRHLRPITVSVNWAASARHSAVVFALFTPVTLVHFAVDNAPLLQVHGLQEDHLIICEAVGIDHAWYQTVAAGQNSLLSATPP